MKQILFNYCSFIISVAAGSGDPHYTTFRGRKYIFASEGEYIAFGVNNTEGNPAFQMQVRLLTRGFKGSYTAAIAFGIPGVYAYQVSCKSPMIF